AASRAVHAGADGRRGAGLSLGGVFAVSNWPFSFDTTQETHGVDGTPLPTAVTAGTANNKGSYTEIAAATGFEYNAVLVHLSATSAADFLVDIAVGAAGVEEPVITNLAAAGRVEASLGGYLFYL